MYYPIQIPYILNKNFSKNIMYSEEIVESLQNFVICFWEMQSLSDTEKSVENIIITDGCIDLVVGYDDREIGYAGMSKTNFNYNIDLPARFFGARLKPGVFHQLTGLPAKTAMDTYIPLDEVDKNFNSDLFFSLSFEQAKEYFKDYFYKLIYDKKPDFFTQMFDALSKDPPHTTAELYQRLYFSPRQCQRLFEKHFGITPQMVLCILRFQQCLEVLTSGKASPGDIFAITTYYDQSHFIKDFKRNIGLTPLELIKKYTD